MDLNYDKIIMDVNKMELLIEKLNNQMEGIAYYNNKITFVKNALPGEIIISDNIKNYNKYNVATIKEITKKSPLRIKNKCPYFNECGGCSLQHVDYKNSLNLKYESFLNLLKINKIKCENIEIIKNKNPFGYRNKIELKIKNFQIGFYKNRSHELIEIDKCLIAKKSINDCLVQIKSLNIKNGDIEIRSNYNDEILLIINTLDKIEINISNFKKHLKLAGVILNDKIYYGDNFFYEMLNNLIFKVSYKSFFQINNYTNELMQKIVINNISQNAKVLDLYCGVGTFTLNTALKAKSVYGVELSVSSIENALKNKKINKINNVEFFQGDTSKIVNKIGNDFDTIIIDPPRSGLNKKTREYLLENNFKKIVCISCNPITLVRDLNEFKNKYYIEKIYLVDSFSYTFHNECICILNLKENLC